MWIAVEFQTGGKQYYYTSPVLVKKGQMVVVEVYGKPTIATVVKRFKTNPYDKPVKSITGLAWSLQDLEQTPIVDEIQPGILDRAISFITGV